jgi:hypothetical protein
MALILRTARCVAALVALAGIVAFNAARANHYILPCRDDCSDPRWVPAGDLSFARSAHTATLLPSGQVLVVGGVSNGVMLDSAELYDPVDGSWSVTGRLDGGRAGHTATLLPNGQVLVVGGVNYQSLDAVAVLYDPGTGKWTRTGAPATNRFDHTATLLHTGKVLVAGGAYAGYVGIAELYDPATGTWSRAGKLKAERALHQATLLADGRVLVTGGTNDADEIFPVSAVELYDPVTGTWSPTSDLNTARSLHTATLLPNGSVLVAGGFGPPNQIPAGCATTPSSTCTIFDTPTNAAELFDPATGQWSNTGSLNAAHAIHTASVLLDGNVLVAGGYGSSSGAIQGAELYDSSRAVWNQTSDLNTARFEYAATPLSNGMVLVVGGNASGALSSAEIYQPGRASTVNGRWHSRPRRFPATVGNP